MDLIEFSWKRIVKLTDCAFICRRRLSSTEALSEEDTKERRLQVA